MMINQISNRKVSDRAAVRYIINPNAFRKASLVYRKNVF